MMTRRQFLVGSAAAFGSPRARARRRSLPRTACTASLVSRQPARSHRRPRRRRQGGQAPGGRVGAARLPLFQENPPSHFPPSGPPPFPNSRFEILRPPTPAAPAAPASPGPPPPNQPLAATPRLRFLPPPHASPLSPGPPAGLGPPPPAPRLPPSLLPPSLPPSPPPSPCAARARGTWAAPAARGAGR